MRKHRFRNRIKSMVGSLIDPDKDEELKGTNIETEDNYSKILELLNDENQQDKNKLAGLIEEFHNRYQTIYQRYDSITGKLKDKVRSKNGKEDSSSSSSSDSDSDNKNGKIDITDSLKLEIESANIEIERLNRKLKIETEEKEALNSQFQSALNTIQETEKMFHESKLQNSKLFAEKNSLISENETAMETIEELKAIRDDFVSELQASEDEKSNVIQTLKTTESENKSLSLKVSELSQQIENDLSTIEDLKSDLEIKGEEVNTLTETVRNLEVKIRLSTQKLHVTEQLLTETDHNHATKYQKLHQQNQILTEKISNLHETITSMKTNIQEKVNNMLKGFDLLTVKFEEDYGHMMMRVCEIKNEMKAVEIQARVNRSNNEYLKEKVEEMVVKLENVRGRVLEKDEKIKELEDVISGKDEEIVCGWEGKKEVIRQLCVWGDYQRDRCDYLQEVVKPMVRR
ncbi:hypothetical protein LXL04_029548 [Taraxacum kok-saghyz]